MSPNRRFRPPLWATLGLAACLVLFISAGLWQLGRAAEKGALFAAFDAAGPAAAARAAPETGTQRYRRVAISGRWEPERQVLLENMLLDGNNGYHVLTPLRADGALLLVNRGWVRAPADRRELPDVALAPAAATVTGLVDRFPRPGLRLAAAGGEDGWPRRMLFPDAADLAAALGEPVLDWQLLLDPGHADGYARRWRPQLMPPATHTGYAVQWFGFAVVLTALYVFLNIRRPDPERDDA